MRIILTAFLITLSFHAFPQCEYNQKGKDEFTGSDVAITKYVELYSDLNTLIKVQLMRVDSLYSIVIGMNIGKIYSIDQGALLMFIMENDSVFAAPSIKFVTATAKESIIGTIWYGATAFALNMNGLNALATLGVKKIRIYTTNGYIQHDISEGNKNAIKSLAACL